MFFHVTENRRRRALRGLVAMILGGMALVGPTLTREVLIVLFGIHVILEGVQSLAVTARRSGGGHGWVLFLKGLLGAAAAAGALIRPAETALGLLILIALWAILTGIVELAAALQLRRTTRGEWMPGLAALLSILLGVLLLLRPGAGLPAVAWLLGMHAIVFASLAAHAGLTDGG